MRKLLPSKACSGNRQYEPIRNECRNAMCCIAWIAGIERESGPTRQGHRAECQALPAVVRCALPAYQACRAGFRKERPAPIGSFLGVARGCAMGTAMANCPFNSCTVVAAEEGLIAPLGRRPRFVRIARKMPAGPCGSRGNSLFRRQLQIPSRLLSSRPGFPEQIWQRR